MAPLRIALRFALTSIASFALCVLLSTIVAAIFSGNISPSQGDGPGWGWIVVSFFCPGLTAACGGYLVARRPWAISGGLASVAPWLVWFASCLAGASSQMEPREVMFSLGLFGWGILGAFLGGDLGDRKRREWERICETLRQRVEDYVGEG